MSKHSLTKKLDYGSNKQDFVGDFIIALRISSSETVLEKSNLGRSEGEGTVKETVPEIESLILVIVLRQKSSKTFLRLMRRQDYDIFNLTQKRKKE